MSKSTVMIIDDSDFVINEMLKALDGYDVVVAKSGAEAIEKLKTANVDLFFVDIHMPSMDGIETIRQIQKDEKYKSVPFCILTTEVNIDYKKQAKDLGVRVWITKPVMANLVRKVVMMIGNGKE